MSSTTKDTRATTGTGHVVGATYRSSYWGSVYRVIGEPTPGTVEVECVEAGGGAHDTPGEKWTHCTHVGKDDLLATSDESEHLDFVNVVEVFEREDGIYVFGSLADAQRFEAAVARGRDLPGDESATYQRETPINVGAAAERLIAAERGDVIEGLGWPSVADDVREGVPLSTVTDRVIDIMDEDAERELLPVLQGWDDEDPKRGES